MIEAHKVNILMVDDQPAKLLSYEAILANLDAHLIKARSGREGLELLLKHDVAVVLLDVSMPEINGFEMADIMRQHPRFQKTAILFISAVRMSDLDRIKGYQSGAVDYISVPVVPEVLRAKVSVFVDLHRKSRELEELNRELETRVDQRTRQLQQSESLLRERADLLELASEAILVRDLAGTLTYWNAGAEAMYGWGRSEVLGNSIHEILRTQPPMCLLGNLEDQLLWVIVSQYFGLGIDLEVMLVDQFVFPRANVIPGVELFAVLVQVPAHASAVAVPIHIR